MEAGARHIHSIEDRLLKRKDKESLLAQHGCVIWMTGLSGSGKSTIAIELERALHEKGIFTQVLDGDTVRTGINNNLGFSDADRAENIRRIAEVTKLFVRSGVVTICSFVSPTRAIREQARTIIGEEDFLEVYIDTPLEECERRDVKGLYAKARAGEIRDFTGVSAPYEAPNSPTIHIRTTDPTPAECAETIIQHILPRVKAR